MLRKKSSAESLLFHVIVAASVSQVFGQGVFPRIHPDQDRGRMEPTRKLSQMTIVFRRTPSQQAALNQLLEEMQDRRSADYHKWLTPDQFGERFGATPAQINQVSGWLRSQSLAVEAVPHGRGWIVFSGNVVQAEQAFHTEIHRYQTGAKLHYGPAIPPSIPAEFDQFIAGVRGLDDFHAEPGIRLNPMFTESNGTHALAPGDLQRIYGYPSLGGFGVTIAVAGESDVNLADIEQFRSTFQLPPNDPQMILFGDDPGIDEAGPFQEGEVDLEWVGGIASYATVIYAYAADAMYAAQNVIDQNLAQILTFSFGTCESVLPTGYASMIQDLAQQANAQGITWIAASGDWGPASCDAGNSVATQGAAVSFPASLPEVTAVGGTEFNEQPSQWSSANSANGSSAGGYLPEIAWNDTSVERSLQASGGGPSSLFAKPSWQVSPGVPNDGARDVPDLSLTASPVHDPYLAILNGKGYTAGGTSVSAQVFAGMVAVAEQNVSGNMPQPVGFGNINPSLYGAGMQTNGPPTFNDITAGSNYVPCEVGTTDCTSGTLGYAAVPGYDLATGLGSVKSLFLQVMTTTTLSIPAAQVPLGSAVTVTATVQAENGAVPPGQVNFSETGSPFVFGGNQSASGVSSTGVATITVTPPVGTYTFTGTFVGYGGEYLPRYAGSTSAPVTLVVMPAPPPAPVLTSPPNGAPGQSVVVPLIWDADPLAASYDVYFGTNPSPPYWGNVASTQCTPGALALNTTYYWRVVARSQYGGTSSVTWSFTTEDTFYTIYTAAGSTVAGFTPDGIPASEAVLSGPTDVALDRNGNLYVVESGNNRVRVINSAGILSTFAGGGKGGDGGPAASAQLNSPQGVAIDLRGNVYISEASDVRLVSPSGMISTFAGGSKSGYSGDGGLAVNALLGGPTGLAVDAQGNLFIADSGNNCIREVSKAIIFTVAGPCQGGAGTPGSSSAATGAFLGGPQGVTVDSSGNVYIADTKNCRIMKVSGGTITQLAGRTEYSPYLCADLGDIEPVRLVFDVSGNLYFTNGANPEGFAGGTQVAKLSNGVVTVLGGGGAVIAENGVAATNAFIEGATGLAVDASGKIYFAESWVGYYPSALQDVRVLSPTSYAPPVPSITSGGIVNGASFSATPLAPGSIAVAFGNFAYSAPEQADGLLLPTSVAGVSLRIQSAAQTIDAPLFYSSTNQTNFQVPWEFAGQSSVTIQPVLNGVAGVSQNLRIAPFSPGIFVGSSNLPAIVDANNTLLALTNPPTAGSIIQIYCTGLGPATNPPATGAVASSSTLSQTTTVPTVTIGGLSAKVVFAGLAPGSVGEYQVQVLVPSGLPKLQQVPVVVSIGGASSNTVYITTD